MSEHENPTPRDCPECERLHDEEPRSRVEGLRALHVARFRLERLVDRHEGQEAALWASWAIADIDAFIGAQPRSRVAGLDRARLAKALHRGLPFRCDPAIVEDIIREYALLAPVEPDREGVQGEPSTTVEGETP